MEKIPISAIDGIDIGQVTDAANKTGVTVFLCEKGATGGVSVRGGAPGTRETDALQPGRLVSHVHGLFLTGGSAFGLAVADGMMQYLEERGAGFDTGVANVPIVSGAVLYDLSEGSSTSRPDAAMGKQACENITSIFEEGRRGAGTGATIGKILGRDRQMLGGIGQYALQIGPLKVGAVVAVNCFGDVYDPATGQKVAGVRHELSTEELLLHGNTAEGKERMNTTIGTVLTNAPLTKDECKTVADIAHNGLARTIRPVHTMLDGDTMFTMATGDINHSSFHQLSVLSVYVVEQAVLSAIRASNLL
ncbi:P1 family peptidase [Aureibacillus halotolerans]|uniref:L-aminopeptidase/D-esterase-like protein n=1 Tax=Aureibacillus halotolerans TaxID=1508390 RepID=A0A4R6U9S7_9BACI|nr:P1 family peptidase [Aureibacillus halotolerans]TDQ41445.1 L-aminopeptidase/D-esterase-like protein [Aureibacillus halotolerans]